MDMIDKIKLSRACKTPLRDQLADALRRMIDKGELKEGDVLPEERALARRLAVSRVTVRGALNCLRREGFLATIRGAGTFVGSRRKGGTKTSCPSSMKRKVVALSTCFYAEDSHIAEMVNSAVKVITDTGYHAMRLGYFEQWRELGNLAFLGESLGGVIVYPGDEPKILGKTATFLRGRNVPFVLIGHRFHEVDATYVASDDAAGTSEATKYFIANKHVNIAYVSRGGIVTTANARRNGYLREMEVAGLEPLFIPEQTQWRLAGRLDNIAMGRHAVMELFAKKKRTVSAIVAENDMVAIGVLKGAVEFGVRIPDEVELIGFGDDLEGRRKWLDEKVELSTVAVPRRAMGRKAAEILLDHMTRDYFTEETVTLPVKLILRKTTSSSMARFTY